MFDWDEIAEAELEVRLVDDDKMMAIPEIEVTVEADNVLEDGEGETICEVTKATDVPDCTLEVCETTDPNEDMADAPVSMLEVCRTLDPNTIVLEDMLDDFSGLA